MEASFNVKLYDHFQTSTLHEFLLHKIVERSDANDFQALLSSFRSSGGMLKKKPKSKLFAFRICFSRENNKFFNAFISSGNH